MDKIRDGKGDAMIMSGKTLLRLAPPMLHLSIGSVRLMFEMRWWCLKGIGEQHITRNDPKVIGN